MKRKIILSKISLCVIAFAAGITGCGGGGGGSTPPAITDTTPPALTMTTYPPSNPPNILYDYQFRNESFFIRIDYSDASPMNESSLGVSFKMDDDPETDVGRFFYFPNNTTIKSNTDFVSDFTQNLFDFFNNNEIRTMTVYVSIKDSAGNRGETTGSFIVYPDSPNGP